MRALSVFVSIDLTMGGAFSTKKPSDPRTQSANTRISGCDQCDTVKCAIQQHCMVKIGVKTGRCFRQNGYGWIKPMHECCCATNGQCPNAPAGWNPNVKCKPNLPIRKNNPYPWWDLPGISAPPYYAVAPDESYIVNESTESPVENNDLDPLLFEGAIAVLAMVMIAVVVMMTRRWRRKTSTKKKKIVEMEMDKVDVDAAENSEEANELLHDHVEHDQN